MRNDIVYTKEMFEKAPQELRDSEKIKRPSIKDWADGWRRLKQNKLAMTGLVLLIILTIMSIVGPQISGYKYYEQNLKKINVKPNKEYWFGTDELGRIYSLVLG